MRLGLGEVSAVLSSHIDTAVALNEDNFDKVLAFLRGTYQDPWLNGPSGEQYYRWKFLDRPARMHSLPAGRLAMAGDRIAGFLGQMPFWLDGAGSSRQASWLCDWNIDAQFRGRGVGSRQLAQSMAAGQATACLVASEEAQAAFRKAGLRPEAQSTLYLYLNRPARFHALKQPSGWRRLAGGLAGFAQGAVFRRGRLDVAAPPQWEMRETQGPLDPAVDPWEKIVSAGEPVRAARRGYDRLEWFLRYPVDGTRLFILHQAGHPMGHVLIRAEPDRLEMMRGRIVDIAAPLRGPEADSVWTWAVSAAAKHLIEDANVDFIEALGSHPFQCSALEGAGFHARARRDIWVHDPLAQGNHKLWFTSFLDKDNATRGAKIGPP